MNVHELVTLLRTFPPDAPVGVAAFTRSGRCIDVAALELATIETTRGDDGTASMVWFAGWRDTAVQVPSIVEMPCDCGDVVAFDPSGLWPLDHDICERSDSA